MLDSLDLPADLQPPMQNGEVVFETPWQSRIFGIAVALSEQGHFAWADFQQHLIRYVSEWDRSASNDDYAYFDHFSKALFALIAERGILSETELDALIKTLRARPHGHDH